jgi:hypothetical protein
VEQEEDVDEADGLHAYDVAGVGEDRGSQLRVQLRVAELRADRDLGN